MFAPVDQTARWPGRKGARWRRAQAECMAAGEANRTPCGWCRGPIDYVFTKLAPRHRMAGTADHIRELWQGGDPYNPENLIPMHRACNTAKSNAQRAGRPRSTVRKLSPQSRQW